MSRAGDARSGPPGLARPPSRWKTRVLPPLLIFAGVCGLVLYSVRDAVWPALDVRVAEVVIKSTGGTRGGEPVGAARTMTVQAPGWVEPDPFAVSVPALTDGVIRELLVLEGQRVDAGQVVARMIDDDARLALERSAALISARSAERDRAKASLAAEQSKAAELRDDIERKRGLVQQGAIGAGEFRQLELRLQGQEAQIKAAEAAVAQGEAALAEARAMHGEAALRLERMQVKSPLAGVVLVRLAEPGSRMMTTGNEPNAAIVLRLYDPAKLQVRVDIPLADAAKVGIGHEAEVTTEALPGITLRGRVSRLVHEANIQKNTVQVKVAIVDPPSELRPEMLMRVRFFAGEPDRAGNAPVRPGEAPRTGAVFVPRAALAALHGTHAEVWVYDEKTRRAVLRSVMLGGTDGDWREALEGLLPGDKVVLDPPTAIREGARLHIAEAKGAKP